LALALLSHGKIFSRAKARQNQISNCDGGSLLTVLLAQALIFGMLAGDRAAYWPKGVFRRHQCVREKG
jgi:hypothetical protein